MLIVLLFSCYWWWYVEIDDSGWYDTGWLSDWDLSLETGVDWLAWENDYDEDGFTENDGDCDDFNPNIHPLMEEIPVDGIDQNCDGLEICYEDIDMDGFGRSPELSPALLCNEEGLCTNNDDCNDRNASINPGATEVCDNRRDNNCNGVADDRDLTTDPESKNSYYRDQDGDGEGNIDDIRRACQISTGYVENALDCDDLDAAKNNADADSDGLSTCGGDCNDFDALSTTIATDGDCDGVVTADDCDDTDSSIGSCSGSKTK